MPTERRFADPAEAERLRLMLSRLGLSQRAAATKLELSDRTMRFYCAGDAHVPAMVFLALDQLMAIARANALVDIVKEHADG